MDQANKPTTTSNEYYLRFAQAHYGDEDQIFSEKPDWRETTHVVDKTLLDKAVVALKEIAKDFGTDYADGNTMIAHETLREIGEKV